MMMTFSIDHTFTQYTKWANEKKIKNKKIIQRYTQKKKKKLIDNTWCLKNEISQITTMVLHVLFKIGIPLC